jgi:hypothetical protein
MQYHKKASVKIQHFEREIQIIPWQGVSFFYPYCFTKVIDTYCCDEKHNNLHKKFNISPLYQKTKSLKNILYHNRPSRQPIDTPGAVYAIPCMNCPIFYIGETKRPTAVRIKEEQRDLKTAKTKPNKQFSDDNDFGYVQHFKETGHQFQFSNTKVLQLEPHYLRRKLTEGIYIRQNTDKICNLKAGTEIDNCWLPLITTMKKFVVTS